MKKIEVNYYDEVLLNPGKGLTSRNKKLKLINRDKKIVILL